MSEQAHNSTLRHNCRYCTLVYQRGNSTEPQLREVPIALMALSASDDTLEIRAHPHLAALIDPDHREYMQHLLRDLAQRKGENPASVFHQLSSLSVGPIVTREAGEDLSGRHDLLATWEEFVELEQGL